MDITATTASHAAMQTLERVAVHHSAITTRTMGFRYPVIVDVEGYKNRQRQKIESVAYSAARRAKSQHRSVKLRPMTPYERRLVHLALRNEPGVENRFRG